ncbi:MAG: hypothetical protein L0241_08015 [Planctomycetia bacterium]|nr:hypothetical protein [Planctomycetia bacterium]
MITPPRRAVTRFFIPLIDVLILLFCIFLLMPFVSGPPSTEPIDAKPPDPKEKLPTDVGELQRQLIEARDRLARMEKANRASVSERLSVRILDIDENTGTLYYFDPDRIDIRTEAEALRLIADQRNIATKAGGVKELLFVFRYPRKQTGFPTAPQVQEIERWFRDVPHMFDY